MLESADNLRAFVLSAFESLGSFGPLIFILGYIIGTWLFVPLSFMTLSAGALFGGPLGFVIASLSSLISAAIIFLAGRYFSRQWIVHKIASSKKMMAVDDAVAKKGWKMV